MYQYPVDGDRHYLKYRKDVIDNPEMQKKYKADTGKTLRVPTTWKEYGEMAANTLTVGIGMEMEKKNTVQLK